MISNDQAANIMGSTLFGANGEKIGKIGQVFLDDQTERPEWVTVHTGFFGTNESFVPLSGANLEGNDVTVGFSKDQVKDAPNVDPTGGHLDESEEQALYRHYGLDRSVGGESRVRDADRTTMADTDTETTMRTRGEGYDTATRGVGDSDAMTRSEEHLVAGTEQVEAGRARLRKYVVTENESVTVPVSKERVTLESEPITEANRGSAMSGAQISEEEHEVVLQEERPVVTTEATPVERVRMGTERVTEQETVTGEVRKERIDLDSDQEVTDRR